MIDDILLFLPMIIFWGLIIFAFVTVYKKGKKKGLTAKDQKGIADWGRPAKGDNNE